MANGSLFMVGDNVELARVLTFLSVLVAFVVVLEQLIHAVKHRAARNPQYLDMVNKIFGELMVLGFVGLALKIYKEATGADAYSRRMIAFQAADLTIFLLAMALIVQALCVFVLLQRKNVQVDKAELVSSAHLLDAITQTAQRNRTHSSAERADGVSSHHRHVFAFGNTRDGSSSSKTTTRIATSDYPELVRMRLLRHLFLRTHGLPELFPFSAYLRLAQDRQLTHMIEVEPSTWVVLLAIAWGLEALACTIREIYAMPEPRAIVYAFVLLAWLSVLLHVAVMAYMCYATTQLLAAAGEPFGGRATTPLACLRAVTDHEARAATDATVADALAAMERVLERERRRNVAHQHHSRWTHHDTGCQLLATDALFLCGFSRKAWHVVVMALLMLNAFFVALFIQCVLHELIDNFQTLGAVLVILTPVPCIVNVLGFHSRILRHFVLVSSVVRVDAVALGDVIRDFSDTVQLRAEFVSTVTAFLDAHNLTVADVETAMRAEDASGTGRLEVEDVRNVLARFGVTLSYFRFNSVAKQLFRLEGTQVAYAQVTRLLLFAQQHDAVRRLHNDTMMLQTTTSNSNMLQSTTSRRLDGDRVMLNLTESLPLERQESARAARSLYQLDFTTMDVEVVETMVDSESDGETTTEKVAHARL